MQDEIMIPKSRFDEVNEERKRLETELSEVRQAFEKAAEESEKSKRELKRILIDSAAEKVLAETSAVNPETVKRMLELPCDDYDGCLYEFFKEQTDKLVSNPQTAFLFKSEQKPCFKGCTPEESSDEPLEQTIVGLDTAIAKHLQLIN